MADIDPLDLYTDPEPGEEGALLDSCIEQIEYHREELRRWQHLKRLAEQAIPKSPVDEMIDIARDAWQQ